MLRGLDYDYSGYLRFYCNYWFCIIDDVGLIMRIISGLLLLIISQISFASLSTTGSITPATQTVTLYWGSSHIGYTYTSGDAACTAEANYFTTSSGYTGTYTFAYTGTYTLNSSGNYYCSANRTTISGGSVVAVNTTISVSKSSSTFIVYSCSSGVLSDASGNASSSGHYCNTSSTVDSCTSLKGQKFYAYTAADTTGNVCEGTCDATFGSASFAPTDKYQEASYVYTGTTDGCTTDTPTVDAATAQAANLQAKIDDEISKAETACGGVGFYTTGQVNGVTTVVCTNQDKKTNITTTTTTSGSTSTTSNTSTTTDNSGQTTTVNPDGTSSTTGGSTNTSGSTTSTTTKTNPDGSTTTTTTASGATGTCDQSDMKGTVACTSLGDIPDTPDSLDVDKPSFSWSYSKWAGSASCPAIVNTAHGRFDPAQMCRFFSLLKPILIALAFVVGAFIIFGFHTSGSED